MAVKSEESNSSAAAGASGDHSRSSALACRRSAASRQSTARRNFASASGCALSECRKRHSSCSSSPVSGAVGGFRTTAVSSLRCAESGLRSASQPSRVSPRASLSCLSSAGDSREISGSATAPMAAAPWAVTAGVATVASTRSSRSSHTTRCEKRGSSTSRDRLPGCAMADGGRSPRPAASSPSSCASSAARRSRSTCACASASKVSVSSQGTRATAPRS
mmetsp:Transcript_15648/g.48658  ORF Transcript_15648/g.48658 Transcript_15648/m.48658 type:complete len:220 (-) Transcript_15648:359-1018(-)